MSPSQEPEAPIGPQKKSCPKCKKIDTTEFSSCRHCGTKYTWVQAEKQNSFDMGSFLRSGIGLAVVLALFAWFGKPIRNMLVGAAAGQVVGDTTKTLKETDLELKVNPKNFDAHVRRSGALIVLFRNKEAIDECTMAINARPKSKVGYLKRAEAYESMGDMDSGKKDRETASVMGE
jgi:hypothetical protein